MELAIVIYLVGSMIAVGIAAAFFDMIDSLPTKIGIVLLVIVMSWIFVGYVIGGNLPARREK